MDKRLSFNTNANIYLKKKMSLILKYSSTVDSKLNGHFCPKEQVKVGSIVYIRLILEHVCGPSEKHARQVLSGSWRVPRKRKRCILTFEMCDNMRTGASHLQL